MSEAAKWWPSLAGPQAVQARLFCVPHAGAGPAAYMRWPRLLELDFAAIHAAQLPGRGARLREESIADVLELAEALAAAAAPLLDKPYFVFGHSLGALLAFELTCALRRAGLPLPRRLFVSGRAAPQLPSPTPHLHNLPQQAFLDELARRYGVADAALDDPEMAELLYPILRADIAAVERYRLGEEPPLPLPIEVLVGQDDPAVPAEALSGWQQHSEQPIRRRTLLGGHFYLIDQPAALLALIRRAVSADLAVEAP